MSTATPTRRRTRLFAAVSFALAGVGMTAGAIPASAADPEGHTVSGVVSQLDAQGVKTPAGGASVTVQLPDGPTREGETAADGSFSISDVPDGEHTIHVWAAEPEEYFREIRDITVDGEDLVLDEIVLMTPIQVGTVEITGDLTPGGTVTAETDGWPAGTTFTYQWEHEGYHSGGTIEGATASTLTIEDEWIGSKIGVWVTGHKSGFASQMIDARTDERVSVPEQPTAPAPVADSALLDAYLAAEGSTPLTHNKTIVGDSWELDPTKDYEAFFWIRSPDSYVDVYLYPESSESTVLGTFPVSPGGSIFIDLDSDLLSELGSGTHTLVVVGQSSGKVISGEFHVAPMLAATGADAAAPAAIAGALLLLGLGALVLARRTRARA